MRLIEMVLIVSQLDLQALSKFNYYVPVMLKIKNSLLKLCRDYCNLMSAGSIQYLISFCYGLHERVPEMQIVLNEVIDKCRDIFLTAHIFPVLNRKFILPI